VTCGQAQLENADQGIGRRYEALPWRGEQCTVGGSVSRSGGHVLGLILSVGFGGWDSAEPVHQALLAEPGDVVDGCTVTDATRLAALVALRRCDGFRTAIGCLPQRRTATGSDVLRVAAPRSRLGLTT
jgi:hypothetical protein